VDLSGFVERFPLFEGLPETELERLSCQLKRRTFAKDGFLWFEGDDADAVYLVETGLVKIFRSGPKGERVVILMAFPGDLIGEPAVLAEAEFRASDAQAEEKTTCLLLRKDMALDFFDRNPILLRRILAWMSTQIWATNDAFVDSAFLDVTARVAKKLLELADARGVSTVEGTRISMRLSQTTLAAMVGASREGVNCALSGFARNGSIAQAAGHITVVRPDDLRRRI
jgi:CRP/FNR family transcriptional regulator, cyclic AMP receptor protein